MSAHRAGRAALCRRPGGNWRAGRLLSDNLVSNFSGT